VWIRARVVPGTGLSVDRVQASAFGFSSFESRVERRGLRVSSGFRAPGSRIRVSDFGFQIPVSGFRFRFRVSDSGFGFQIPVSGIACKVALAAFQKRGRGREPGPFLFRLGFRVWG